MEIKGAEDAHIFVNGVERGTSQKRQYGLSLDCPSRKPQTSEIIGVAEFPE
jgi:hypothetical protein